MRAVSLPNLTCACSGSTYIAIWCCCFCYREGMLLPEAEQAYSGHRACGARWSARWRRTAAAPPWQIMEP